MSKKINSNKFDEDEDSFIEWYFNFHIHLGFMILFIGQIAVMITLIWEIYNG